MLLVRFSMIFGESNLNGKIFVTRHPLIETPSDKRIYSVENYGLFRFLVETNLKLYCNILYQAGGF